MGARGFLSAASLDTASTTWYWMGGKRGIYFWQGPFTIAGESDEHVFLCQDPMGLHGPQETMVSMLYLVCGDISSLSAPCKEI
jgi:hypothetical protein